jgi:hypothetical protein
VIAVGLAIVHAQDAQKPLGFTDTPMLPGGKWHVHDGNRPQPAVVTPGTFSTPDRPGTPPSDAVVLFNGTDLSQWRNEKDGPAGWTIDGGAMVVAVGAGDIHTKESFGDCQLHVEWEAPTPAKGDGQDRGNSGVFLMSRYEIQVLDSYGARTYPDGQAAAIFGQFPPLVNAARKPGEWQSYDVVFTAPRFNGQTVEAPAAITVFHNGVVVHNHTALLGSTVYRALAKYEVHPAKAPLVLQEHEHPVRYRNVWIRALKGYDER